MPGSPVAPVGSPACEAARRLGIAREVGSSRIVGLVEGAARLHVDVVAAYRGAPILVAVLVALASRVVIATPSLALNEIKAARCCTKDCPGAGTPDRCCEYRREAGDPAAIAARATAPTFFAVAAALSRLDWTAPVASPRDRPSDRSTGPPRFLRLGVLRL